VTSPLARPQESFLFVEVATHRTAKDGRPTQYQPTKDESLDAALVQSMQMSEVVWWMRRRTYVEVELLLSFSRSDSCRTDLPVRLVISLCSHCCCDYFVVVTCWVVSIHSTSPAQLASFHSPCYVYTLHSTYSASSCLITWHFVC